MSGERSDALDAILAAHMRGIRAYTRPPIDKFARVLATLTVNLELLSCYFEQVAFAPESAGTGAVLLHAREIEKTKYALPSAVDLLVAMAATTFTADTVHAAEASACRVRVSEITRAVNAAYLFVNAVAKNGESHGGVLNESARKAAVENIRAGYAEINAATAAAKALSKAFVVRE